MMYLLFYLKLHFQILLLSYLVSICILLKPPGSEIYLSIFCKWNKNSEISSHPWLNTSTEHWKLRLSWETSFIELFHRFLYSYIIHPRDLLWSVISSYPVTINIFHTSGPLFSGRCVPFPWLSGPLRKISNPQIYPIG
jgi:hypothetical protein